MSKKNRTSVTGELCIELSHVNGKFKGNLKPYGIMLRIYTPMARFTLTQIGVKQCSPHMWMWWTKNKWMNMPRDWPILLMNLLNCDQ